MLRTNDCIAVVKDVWNGILTYTAVLERDRGNGIGAFVSRASGNNKMLEISYVGIRTLEREPEDAGVITLYVYK
jgi:hypothetical protein